MRRLLSVLAALLLLAGCGKRERLNPFDPANPVTGGRPAGFVALAGNGLARLRWDATSTPELLGYQLQRRAATESTYRVIAALLPTSTTSIGDFGLLNGVDHHYRLYFVFLSGTSGPPAEDVATPGPLRPWVADGGLGSLVRLTADGRHVAFEQTGFPGPSGVAVDMAGGLVWLTDPFAHIVTIYDPSTGNQIVIGSSLVSPGAVAIDPADRTAWVCDAGINQVLHFTPSGGPAIPAQLTSIDDPLDVAVDPTDRSVWVCERGADHVRHYSATGVLSATATVTAPSRVAVDSLTHEAWVTSFDGRNVVRLSPAAVPLNTVGGFSGPIGIAVDARRGRIWVADALGDRLVALRRDGSVEFRVAGLSEVRAIALDLASGEAWCTTPGSGRVARVSAAGVVLQNAGGLGAPDGIAMGVGAP